MGLNAGRMKANKLERPGTGAPVDVAASSAGRSAPIRWADSKPLR